MPAACLAMACALLALAPLAHGANRRVAIGDFRWTPQQVTIDLGEHVTWHWVGPDTLHSVTGASPNAAGLDSDPGDNFPDHPPGDAFRLDFNTPGTYDFVCKLHAAVRGSVTVTSNPGDPNLEVDPVPDLAVDLVAPELSGMALARPRFRRTGTALRFELDERALVEAQYFRLRKGTRPRYAGFREWRGHIGFNSVKFGGRSAKFGAKPGRYKAAVRATDASSNTSFAGRLKFQIVQPKKKGKRKK